MGVNNNFDLYNPSLHFYITDLENRNKFSEGTTKHQVLFKLHPITGKALTSGSVSFKTHYGTAHHSNEAFATKWDNKNNLFAHVSLWRQDQRLRMYVNGDKLFDLPRIFEAGNKYNALIFYVPYKFKSGKDDYYLLSNMRLAVGAPDTRTKLLTEGKFVTRGILFDANSDKIKPESTGTLKEIGNILKENASVKVQIVGHTDADGDDKANIDLSKRRAEAVKAFLVKEYNITTENLSAEGKGESQPVDKNDTIEGKANNRRVEFIKI